MKRRIAILCVSSVLSVACAGVQPTVRQRAAVAMDRKDYGEAARLLREHLAQHPGAIPERQLLIRVLAASGQLGEAREQTEELRQQLPEGDALPYIELGHAFELSHRYEEALALYDAATEVAPKDPRGPKTGGLRAARWGEVELAAPRLEEAARRDPRDAETWHALGLVRAQLGDLSGARKAYTSGLQADPGAVENHLGLASLAVQADQPSVALRHYTALLRARPRFAPGYLGQSWALLRLGRYDEAEQALDRGAELGANRRVVARQRQLLQHLRKAAEVKEKR
ncbi:MAG: tetratricopeptide repeat protein [Polyangiaceae bacterium]|nr:tetratricopeptide repeat protein [Polyangiaceae bacterium]